MAPMKLYGLAMATCTARVLAGAYEKGIDDIQIEKVDLFSGAHKKPEFLALQPFGVIPVLQDGDLTLFESRAILRYLANKYEGQGTSLYGKTLEEKAKVEQWLEVESQNYNGPISSIVHQLVFGPMRGQTPNEAVVAEAVAKAEKILDIYEEHLGKVEYLAGDFFSLADVSHLPYTYYLINKTNKGDIITSRKNVNAWWDRISSRPAWKKVLEAQK